jgi:two-component system nitrogen regulation sensor histidine kinase NtrY
LRLASKFEWRIMLALLLTAVLPLIFTAFLVERLVRESMAVGINDQVISGLQTGVDLYKEVIESRLKIARLQGQAAARDSLLRSCLEKGELDQVQQLLEDLLAATEGAVRVSLLAGGQPVLRAESPRQFSEEKYRFRQESWRLPADHQLVMTLAIERDFLQAADELRDLVVKLEEVKKNFSAWQSAYYRLFLFIYVWILATVVALAVLMARSVTRRVSRLVKATRAVASGNLEARVPVSGQDEIGELLASFNVMLDEIRRGRDRIVYLEKISAWQGMARRLAHEIKNPLTPIQLAIQELHRSYRGGDPAFQNKLNLSLEIVEEEIRTLRRLVETFSEFSKMPPLQAETVEINAFLEEFLLHHPHLAGMIQLKRSQPALVKLDRGLITRVLVNLIQNAVEAAGENRPVDLEVETGSAWVTLRVADRGPGLSPEAKEKLFQPYFTSKPQGTGLGLAIVKKIVLQHGGEISAGDRPGGGAVFSIQLRAEAGTEVKTNA